MGFCCVLSLFTIVSSRDYVRKYMGSTHEDLIANLGREGGKRCSIHTHNLEACTGSVFLRTVQENGREIKNFIRTIRGVKCMTQGTCTKEGTFNY